VRIVAIPVKGCRAGYRKMFDLARGLAREGRSIAINLDPSGLPEVGSRTGPSKPKPGLGDLIAGTASFAEVIRRDPASRLHVLPLGESGDIELQEFEDVLDTLAGTYDYIMMIAPPPEQNETAKTLAADADFAVLAVPAEPSGAIFEAERQLIESGAGEVLLIALSGSAARGRGRGAE
jgi:MinD-like ATPase involved in chromosome partitioning or flagellar assembly